MRSSAHLSDCNDIYLRRSVPICIRWTLQWGILGTPGLQPQWPQRWLWKTDEWKKNAWSTQDICIQTLQLLQSNHLNPIKSTLSSRSWGVDTSSKCTSLAKYRFKINYENQCLALDHTLSVSLPLAHFINYLFGKWILENHKETI